MQPRRFVSGVDSLAQPDASAKKRYIIMPGSKDVQPGDLQFLEYAGYVEKILNEKGFVKASQFADADIAVFLSYGIGNPKHTNTPIHCLYGVKQGFRHRPLMEHCPPTVA
jgi:hypothetical protein